LQHSQSVPSADPAAPQHSRVTAQSGDPRSFFQRCKAPGHRRHVPAGRQAAHGYRPEGGDPVGGSHRVAAAAHGVGRRAGRSLE